MQKINTLDVLGSDRERRLRGEGGLALSQSIVKNKQQMITKEPCFHSNEGHDMVLNTVGAPETKLTGGEV